MWNSLDLPCPSEDMCKYDEKDADLILEMSNLATLLTSSAECLTQESPVWEEIKVFQNIQAKYKQILHCDKNLVLLQRVGGCLRKMVILNLSKSFLDLGELIIKGLQKKGHQTLFPSKQQVEFLLIRCQSASKLVLEALHFSREAFFYLVQKLNVGHLVVHLVMAISVTARVNILFKSILANLFSIYRKLYPWLNILKNGNHEWPRNLNLPDDLEIWLKPDENQLLSPMHLSQEKIDSLTNFFKKPKGPPENDSDSVVEVESEDDCIIESAKKENNGTDTSEDISKFTDEQDMDTADDVGEVILRESETEESNPETQAILNLMPKQRMLVRKIKAAKNLKRIRIIWNHLNVSNPDLLPKALTPGEIRVVEKMLSRHKREILELKSLSLPKSMKQQKKLFIVKLAARKLIRHLGLSKPPAAPLSGNTSLGTVRTFAGLKNLYQTLYDRLQSQQRYDKCEELKKVFKSRKEDLKLLKERNEKGVIANLIFCTSKVFQALYEK